jgi:ubiquitin-conjugating enzyme E2 I
MAAEQGVARQRLAQERKDFNKDRPYGFYAKPRRAADGSTNIMVWECGILPLAASPYALPNEGTYRVLLNFSADYPSKPPVAHFSPPIFHTNVFPSGSVCLSLLLEAGHHGGRVASHWSADVSMRQILLGLQAFLDEPNAKSVANGEACALYNASARKYEARVREEAKAYSAALAAAVDKEKRTGVTG